MVISRLKQSIIIKLATRVSSVSGSIEMLKKAPGIKATIPLPAKLFDEESFLRLFKKQGIKLRRSLGGFGEGTHFRTSDGYHVIHSPNEGRGFLRMHKDKSSPDSPMGLLNHFKDDVIPHVTKTIPERLRLGL